MIEIVGELVNMGFPPYLALAGGVIWLYIRTSKALKEAQAALASCKLAKQGCNDEVHRLHIKISDLESGVLSAQARVVALELELERRVGDLESQNPH